MASIVIGSKIFVDMFGQTEMRALFSDEKTVQLYLDVEAALADVGRGQDCQATALGNARRNGSGS